MRDPGPAETVVRAACPHDCPDTCAMLVTVREQDGRRVAVKIAGDPEHPTTAGVLCTKVSRYLERTYHPDRVLHPLRRIGRKGDGRFERVSWDEALADIAGRLKGIAARDPQRIVPYSYAGTMGLVQGEAMASRFFHQLGASFLDRTICATAGGEALAATLGTRLGHGHRAVPGRPAHRLLGHQCHRVESASLEPRPGSQAAGREAHRDRPVPLADGREVPSAHRADARHRRRVRARRDPRAGARRLAGPRLHRSLHAGLRGAGRARAWLRSRPRRRAVRHPSRTKSRIRARLLGGAARRDSPELRNAAHARRRQRRARRRLPPGARGTLARPRGRLAAVDQRGVSGRRGRAVSAGPARRPPSPHHQHVDDRARPARGRPADRRADRLRQQPGGGGAAVVGGRAGVRARGSLHGGPRALPDGHGGLR